jgi:phosphoribosylaminoimidazolecarboxamide formyltransferase/IMP cyclohydrolase
VSICIHLLKTGGNFIVLKADKSFIPPPNEYREVYGMAFMQKRNSVAITKAALDNVVTTKQTSFSEDAIRDLTLASICLKYTQSNSVGYAIDGQMVGVGAGQQSRVDCVKLAGRKVEVWMLRQHPKVQELKFKDGVKRQARVNARVRFIEGMYVCTYVCALFACQLNCPWCFMVYTREIVACVIFYTP